MHQRRSAGFWPVWFALSWLAFGLELRSEPVVPSVQPVVLGAGVGAFAVGEVLHAAPLDEPAKWRLQIQKPRTATHEKVTFSPGSLDLYMPDRGCTAWFDQKLEGGIAIVYRVRCPVETLADPGIQARDINNFWHASDPVQSGDVLDSAKYDGVFGGYDPMLGYYASTGGGNATGNQTTRFRRYPRKVAGAEAPHIALTNRDQQKEFLITPGKWHTVQLVAFRGIAQYIVDGVLVYEIYPGSPVTVEVPLTGGPAAVSQKEYQLAEFPAYTEGYFGLRMVGTHHQYADLKIYRLNPLSVGQPSLR